MKKTTMNRIKVAAITVATSAAAAAPCLAADELGAIAIDTSNFVTAAVALVGALVTFWGIKKALSLVGR